MNWIYTVLLSGCNDILKIIVGYSHIKIVAAQESWNCAATLVVFLLESDACFFEFGIHLFL